MNDSKFSTELLDSFGIPSALSLSPLPGVCCGNLEEQKGLMKMGLCMVLVGHVNFLLGALVHGVVLRHFSLQRGQAMESAISNVLALTAGLLVRRDIIVKWAI